MEPRYITTLSANSSLQSINSVFSSSRLSFHHPPDIRCSQLIFIPTMHLPTLVLAVLPALTLAAPFDARSSTGSWFFSLSKSYYANGYHSQTVFANYTSDSYPSGLVTNCRYVQDPTQQPPVDSASCDQEGFSWSYDNEGTSSLVF